MTKKLIAFSLIISLMFYLFPAKLLAGGSLNSIAGIKSQNEQTLYPKGEILSDSGLNKGKEINNDSSYLNGKEKEGFLSKISWSIVGGFIGAAIALWLGKFQKPRLFLETGNVADDEETYPVGYFVPGRWKFFRLKVTNNKLPQYLSWFMSRETAENIHAFITFKELEKEMKGRWSRKLELAYASGFDKIKLAQYPEPETIFVGDFAILDIFAKYESYSEAYGWNNESYLPPDYWKNINYKLEPGDYEIEVRLIGTNTDKKVLLLAHIANSIEDSYLTKK